MKILISDQLEQSCIDILVREGFTVDNRPGLPPEELLSVVGEYDALVVRSATKVTADVIANASRMKVIGRAGTGVDNIDIDAATRRGILVMNTPGGNTISAAEHTVSMLLSLARNIPQAYASLLRGEWERKKFTGTEVFEKTVGVVGLGKIGREVASRCLGLGMKILGYDPVLAPDAASRLNIELVDLPDLFRRADFITVHTPLTPETKGLLNDATLARCKKGVRVINCARGGSSTRRRSSADWNRGMWGVRRSTFSRKSRRKITPCSAIPGLSRPRTWARQPKRRRRKWPCRSPTRSPTRFTDAHTPGL